MSAVLRVSGVNLAIDDFLALSKLTPVSVFRKGEPRYPASQPNGRKFDRSGANFSASEADMSDFNLQLEEAEVFLRAYATEISALRDLPGMESVTLDFGVETKPPHWSTFTLPHSLSEMATRLEIDLAISVYPSSDEKE